jgi:hypothetical protein
MSDIDAFCADILLTITVIIGSKLSRQDVRMGVGIGSSSHDLSGAFMTIFLISSDDAGRKTVIGSPSNSISAHKEEFKNYHPVSNLPFISKILEKVVSTRLEEHINSHSLHDNLQ